MFKKNVSESLSGKSLRRKVPPTWCNPVVNNPVSALLIKGEMIVANGANGPNSGLNAFPKAVKIPEMINDGTDEAVGEGTAGAAAVGTGAAGGVAATACRKSLESVD